MPSKILTDKLAEYQAAYERCGALIEVVDAYIALARYALSPDFKFSDPGS